MCFGGEGNVFMLVVRDLMESKCKDLRWNLNLKISIPLITAPIHLYLYYALVLSLSLTHLLFLFLPPLFHT